jgi:hypothetical protein
MKAAHVCLFLVCLHPSWSVVAYAQKSSQAGCSVDVIDVNCAPATPLIDSPRPKVNSERHSNKVFFIGAAALAAAKSWDAGSTVSCIQMGCYESESDWAVGRYPTGAALAGFDSAVYSAIVTGFYFTERSRRNWLRWSGRIFVAVSVGGAARAAIHNAGVCRPAGTCHPI